MERIGRFQPHGPCPACSTIAIDRRTGRQVPHDVEYVPPVIPGWIGKMFGKRLESAYLKVTCIECGYTQSLPPGWQSET